MKRLLTISVAIMLISAMQLAQAAPLYNWDFNSGYDTYMFAKVRTSDKNLSLVDLGGGDKAVKFKNVSTTTNGVADGCDWQGKGAYMGRSSYNYHARGNNIRYAFTIWHDPGSPVSDIIAGITNYPGYPAYANQVTGIYPSWIHHAVIDTTSTDPQYNKLIVTTNEGASGPPYSLVGAGGYNSWANTPNGQAQFWGCSPTITPYLTKFNEAWTTTTATSKATAFIVRAYMGNDMGAKLDFSTDGGYTFVQDTDTTNNPDTEQDPGTAPYYPRFSLVAGVYGPSAWYLDDLILEDDLHTFYPLVHAINAADSWSLF